MGQRCFILGRAWGRLEADGRVLTQAADGRYMDRVAGAFERSDLALVVVRPADHPFVGAYEHPVPSSAERGLLRLEPSAGAIGGFKNLWSVVRASRGADTVFVFMASVLAALTVLVARYRGQRVVVYSGIHWARESARESSGRGVLVRLLKPLIAGVLERFSMKAAHVRILNSSSLRRECARLPGVTEKTRPVTALSADDARPPRESTGGGPLRLIYVGAVIERKNLETMYRALDSLVRAGLDARLRVIGAFGPPGYVDALHRLIGSLGLGDRVEYLGYFSEPRRVIDELRASDAFVLTSLSEGFPRAVWEAMLQGVPCALSNIEPILDELGDEDRCAWCDASDPESVARAIRRLAFDKEYRNRIAWNGYRYAMDVFREPWGDQLSRVLALPQANPAERQERKEAGGRDQIAPP